ncbi:MAG: dicarboxylate/amino acid:cation symporter, partial [Chthoniobacterales bacterium]
DIYNFLGTLFLRGLQMLVVPLVVTAMISAMGRIGEDKSFGRLGLKTGAYYIGTGFLAIVTGLVVMNLVHPGNVPKETSAQLIALAQGDVKQIQTAVAGHSASDMATIFLRMVPANIFDSLSRNGEMLSLIFFSLIFGFFSTKLPQPMRGNFAEFWRAAYETIMLITDWVVKFAPIGVFGLIAKTVATTGLQTFGPLFGFFLCVVGALLIHACITLPIVLRVFGISPIRHMKAMTPALLTAFSTASSNASLPVTMECLEKTTRVSERVRGFFLPVGANINTDGTALYECAAAIFITQVYGIHITPYVQFLVVFLALLTSIGVAGVPAASLVAIVIILNAIGLPLEAIGLVMAVDRILDMCRTAVNVYGDSCGATIIAKSEGETLAY